MSEHPNDQLIRVRWDTYMVLRRLREDRGYETFDSLVREALKAKYGPGLDLQ
jgi:hypothetical protein